MLWDGVRVGVWGVWRPTSRPRPPRTDADEAEQARFLHGCARGVEHVSLYELR